MPELQTRHDGAIATVVFSNPSRFNALTYDMWRAIPETLARLDADPDVRLIVLTGDGERAFASGADISQFEQNRAGPDAQERYDAALDAAYLAPGRCSKPVIARIRGICMGGGLGIAAGCDIRLCSSGSVFRMPAARMGLSYGFTGVQRFAELIGFANTADIFFSARTFDAADAHRMGFIQHVFDDADFEREADRYCQVIAENAPLTLLASKRSLTEARKDPVERDLAAAQAADRACMASEDFVEGRRAFMEKRPPRFNGR